MKALRDYFSLKTPLTHSLTSLWARDVFLSNTVINSSSSSVYSACRNLSVCSYSRPNTKRTKVLELRELHCAHPREAIRRANLCKNEIYILFFATWSLLGAACGASTPWSACGAELQTFRLWNFNKISQLVELSFNTIRLWNFNPISFWWALTPSDCGASILSACGAEIQPCQLLELSFNPIRLWSVHPTRFESLPILSQKKQRNAKQHANPATILLQMWQIYEAWQKIYIQTDKWKIAIVKEVHNDCNEQTLQP